MRVELTIELGLDAARAGTIDRVRQADGVRSIVVMSWTLRRS